MTSDEQHIHSSFFAPVLDVAQERLGIERTRAVLAAVGTDEATLRDTSAWVSNRVAEAVVDGLVEESGDFDLLDEVGRRMFTGNYLGLLKPVLKVLGSPQSAFARFPTTSPRWNKAGVWTVHDLGEGYTDISFASRIERSVHMCHGRSSQIASLPLLFGLEPGTIEHSACMHRGDAECRYQMRWQPARGGLSLLLPRMALGLAAGVAIGLASGASVILLAVLAAMGALTGALTAQVTKLEQHRHDQLERLSVQDRALNDSLRAGEARYLELLEAKQDVDRQVDARTTELRETSAQLSSALSELREQGELQQRLFANVSHELRTPLQLIMGPLHDLVREPTHDAATRDRLRIMSRNADRLHRLIAQILDLMRAEAGQISLQRVAVQPDDLARQVVAAFEAAATSTRVQLTVQAEPSAAAQLDVHWLESALTNLVANALRHCDAGDTVTVGVSEEDQDLIIEVVDTGPGIPAADLPQIFDRFAQSVQKEGGPRGTGLGLAIVREAARLHGGEATVRSTVGVGTTFRIQIPFVAASSEAVCLQGRPAQPTVAHQEALTTYDGPGPDAPLAVVAEDEPDLRAYVATTLASRFRVVACADGAIALEQIRQRVPDLVVSDRSMPGLTGTELCRRLRQETTTARIPVLLLTAHHSPDDVVAGYDAGADDYVVKPFHPSELHARVEVQLRLRRLAQDAVVRERLASIGMLSAEIAHHFRNPLNFLKSGLPVVKRQLDDGWLTKHGRFWDTMVESTGRLELLTTDLLRLARGHRSAEVEILDPSEALKSAVRLIDATLPPDVNVQLARIDDVRVRGRSGDLNQVVLNLLDNAARALEGSGTIRVGARCEGEDYVIDVEDSGPGVPEELQAHLFDAFVSTRAHGQGSGLGLAIAAKVVQEHRGTIEVGSSEALGGARFRIRLPAELASTP
ncbi:MAG: response regulator [Myxococcales bacterium]|nr:response regulator [Myxococcales bacterium]